MRREERARADLRNEIGLVEETLSDYHKNLAEVAESGLVDYYAYQIKSYEAKHRYLMRKIKNLDDSKEEREV